jgi:hypothetical protein
VELWDGNKGIAPRNVVREVLRALITHRKSGILQLEGHGTTDQRVFFYQGLIVGCESVADDWLIARLLVASQLVRAEDLQTAVEVRFVESIHETMVAQGLVNRGALAPFLVESFLDNVHALGIGYWCRIDFVPTAVVTPTNMQFGNDPEDLLDSIARFSDRVRPLLKQVRLQPGKRLTLNPAMPPINGEDGLVASLLTKPCSLADVLSRSPLPRYRTLNHVAELVAEDRASLD